MLGQIAYVALTSEMLGQAHGSYLSIYTNHVRGPSSAQSGCGVR